jgi:hypothetical protein
VRVAALRREQEEADRIRREQEAVFGAAEELPQRPAIVVAALPSQRPTEPMTRSPVRQTNRRVPVVDDLEALYAAALAGGGNLGSNQTRLCGCRQPRTAQAHVLGRTES